MREGPGSMVSRPTTLRGAPRRVPRWAMGLVGILALGLPLLLGKAGVSGIPGDFGKMSARAGLWRLFSRHAIVGICGQHMTWFRRFPRCHVFTICNRAYSKQYPAPRGIVSMNPTRL